MCACARMRASVRHLLGLRVHTGIWALQPHCIGTRIFAHVYVCACVHMRASVRHLLGLRVHTGIWALQPQCIGTRILAHVYVCACVHMRVSVRHLVGLRAHTGAWMQQPLHTRARVHQSPFKQAASITQAFPLRSLQAVSHTFPLPPIGPHSALKLLDCAPKIQAPPPLNCQPRHLPACLAFPPSRLAAPGPPLSPSPFPMPMALCLAWTTGHRSQPQASGSHRSHRSHMNHRQPQQPHEPQASGSYRSQPQPTTSQASHRQAAAPPCGQEEQTFGTAARQGSRPHCTHCDRASPHTPHTCVPGAPSACASSMVRPSAAPCTSSNTHPNAAAPAPAIKSWAVPQEQVSKGSLAGRSVGKSGAWPWQQAGGEGHNTRLCVRPATLGWASAFMGAQAGLPLSLARPYPCLGGQATGESAPISC